MVLQKISKKHIDLMLEKHDLNEGNLVNNSLLKLFSEMNDNKSKYEVSIKVAALNQLYSTSIMYIKPVVEMIVEKCSFENNKYVELVDEIAVIEWENKSKNKKYRRNNLSFSSKYVHFLSEYKIPIYDSYIWILLIGYLKEDGVKNISFKPPTKYIDFYLIFEQFRNRFNILKDYSIYQIDKFLWQYGKNLILEISDRENVNLSKAKTILKKKFNK